MEHLENTANFMEKCRLLLAQGDAVPLPVQGGSMAPFLVHQRDTVWVKTPTQPLKIGDIVLYQRMNGDYILHRICGIEDDTYTMIGDAHTVRESGIRREQIFGIAAQAQRKGCIQKSGCFWWEFFARIWVRIIPLRSVLLRIYSLVLNRFRRLP